MKKIIPLASLLFVLSVFNTSAQSVPLDPVVLIPGIGASVNMDVFTGKIPIETSWGFVKEAENYDDIIDALEIKGYVLNQDLFIAHYDWRQSNVNSAADYLVPVINQAKQNSPSGKVDIIAHSMGGLVARAYIQGSNYRNDIDQIFLIGTPNYGSSDAYGFWEGRIIPEHWPRNIKTQLTRYIWYLKIANGMDDFDVIHTFFPSIKELLPLYNYITDKDTGAMKPAGDMQEQNATLSALNDITTSNGLQALFGRVREINVIAGTGTSTLAFIPVVQREANETKLWADGKPDPINPLADTTAGDNTVLVQSAFFPFPDIEPYDPTPAFNTDPLWRRWLTQLTRQVFAQSADCQGIACFRQRTIADTDHMNLPTESIELVFERLNLGPMSIEFSPHYDPEEILSFWFASPVDVKIVSPDGKTVTKDLNEISGASYESTSDPLGPKFITISDPLSGTYQIEIVGIGDGEYHMGVSYVDSDSDVVNTVEGTIGTGQGIGYTVSYDPSDTESPADISDPLPIADEEKTALDLIDELISDIEQYYKDGLIKGLLVKKSLVVNFTILKSEIKEWEELQEKYENKPTKQTERKIKVLEGLIHMHIKGSIDLLNLYSKKKIIDSQAVSNMVEKLTDIAEALK